jgi:hypothetical protein
MPTTIPTTTSSTRPGSPSTGDAYFETDTKNYIIYDGANWRGYASDGIIYSFPSNSYSASFDGVNDYIDTNNKFDFIQKTCNFSITCWVKFADYTSTASNEYIIHSSDSNGRVGFMLYYDNRSNTKKLITIVSTTTSVETPIAVTDGITDNNWHHIAVTCSGSGGTLRLYKDGVEIGNTTAPTAGSVSAIQTLTLGGALNTSGNLVLPFEGNLDEVAVFNYELTSTQINSIRSSPYNYLGLTSIYRFENNADDSVGANNGTNNGVTFSTTDKPY